MLVILGTSHRKTTERPVLDAPGSSSIQSGVGVIQHKTDGFSGCSTVQSGVGVIQNETEGLSGGSSVQSGVGVIQHETERLLLHLSACYVDAVCS